ncbi:unnamed protein product [Orchesella dallaii]|uniref:Nardilysin n=1 Tax=Orchesella dallaii TaxID=48710 RepID=A0ABP1S7J3_9HEXA
MRISNNTHSPNVNSKVMMTLPPNPSTNQQSQPCEQNSKSCKKCCKCPDYSENSKFQTPFTPIPNTADSSTYSSDDIIKSPLDQRLYKSITLTNGIRVMLISTIEVDSNDDAVDATKTPCQVPGLADFNKTYLGFDNPAARVKCACPCDKRKPCCGMGCGKEANRKSILKEFENIKAACCAKQDRPSSADKRVSFQDDEKTLANFRDEVERPSNPDYINNYQAALFDAMNRRAQRRKIKQASATYKQHEEETRGTKKTQGQEMDENHSNFNQEAKKKHEETPASRLDKERQKRSMNLKNCHNFQSYSRGLHGTHSVSTKTRPRINRPKFTSSLDYDFDLEASAYLVIGAGYFDDPLDQVGLAHFCEHCVFLGSRFFPEPDMLSRLVSPFGGFANAYTSGMMTTFYTSTPPMLFPLAVEILGDMIGFPLFPLELVTAELEALDSEYSFRHDDEPEYFQLLASLAKDGHAMKKNSGGNMSTIKVPNFYRRLVEWKRVYYNPKRITVALEAPLPLDYLERLAILSFGEIASSTLQPCINNRYLLQNSPFEMSRFHQIYHVPSVYPSEYLILHWTLESKAWKNLRVKPLEYLAAIMEHKCEGGLFHYLTTQGLATQITAGCWESDTTRNHFTSVFAIQVSMTEKGFKRQDNILQAIFGYIQMLICARPQQTFFQEIQKQALDSFHYNGAKGTHSVAEMLSKWMQFIPPKWCLISPVLITNFDEEFLHRYTESLKIETVNVMIFSKKYHGAEYIRNRSMDDKNAPAFTAFQFPQELEEKIRKTLTKYAAHFTLPPPNPLLLDTKCSRSREQDLLEVGKLYTDDCLTVSYTDRKMHMTKGLLPQARYSWWIISEVTSVARVHPKLQDAVQACMLLMTGLFNEMFETKFYHTCNADILLQASVFEGQLNVFFEGPYTALPSVMEQLVEIFDEFEDVLDEIQFEAGRTTFINLLDDAILDNQLLAWDLFDYLWTNDHPLIFDLKSLLERMNE